MPSSHNLFSPASPLKRNPGGTKPRPSLGRTPRRHLATEHTRSGLCREVLPVSVVTAMQMAPDADIQLIGIVRTSSGVVPLRCWVFAAALADLAQRDRAGERDARSVVRTCSAIMIRAVAHRAMVCRSIRERLIGNVCEAADHQTPNDDLAPSKRLLLRSCPLNLGGVRHLEPRPPRQIELRLKSWIEERHFITTNVRHKDFPFPFDCTVLHQLPRTP